MPRHKTISAPARRKLLSIVRWRGGVPFPKHSLSTNRTRSKAFLPPSRWIKTSFKSVWSNWYVPLKTSSASFTASIIAQYHALGCNLSTETSGILPTGLCTTTGAACGGWPMALGIPLALAFGSGATVVVGDGRPAARPTAVEFLPQRQWVRQRRSLHLEQGPRSEIGPSRFLRDRVHGIPECTTPLQKIWPGILTNEGPSHCKNLSQTAYGSCCVVSNGRVVVRVVD